MKANPEEILLVSGISKGYARHQLWSNVSFGLTRGEALGIRGSNGADMFFSRARIFLGGQADGIIALLWDMCRRKLRSIRS